MFSKLGLKKIFLLFVILVSCITVVSGIVSFFTSGKAIMDLSDIGRRGVGELSQMNSVVKSFASLHSNVLATAAESDADSRTLRVEVVDGYVKEASDQFKKCQKCRNLEAKYSSYFELWAKTKGDFLSKNNASGALQFVVQKMVPVAEGLLDDIDKTLGQTNTSFVNDAEAQIVQSKKVRQILLFSILGTSFVLITLGLYFRSLVVRSLDRVAGDLQRSTSETSQVAEHLSSSSEQLTSASGRQASSAQQTTASLHELSSMVQANSKSATEASEIAGKGVQVALSGGQEISGLIERMKHISESSRKIEEIIEVIDDISFQTNLLALNASVEAARAGEQGRGFAVVADAVRSLAQRSADSAKEISGLIHAIVQQIEEGRKTADSSGEALKKIIESIDKMNLLTKEMATSSVEQAQGVRQLEDAMNEIDTNIQSNVTVSGAVAASADKLMSQADRLNTETVSLNRLINGSLSLKKTA